MDAKEKELLAMHDQMLKTQQEQLTKQQLQLDTQDRRLQSAEQQITTALATIQESNQWLRTTLTEQTKSINEQSFNLQKSREDRKIRDSEYRRERSREMYKLVGIAIGGGGIISLIIQSVLQFLQ